MNFELISVYHGHNASECYSVQIIFEMTVLVPWRKRVISTNLSLKEGVSNVSKTSTKTA